MRIDEVEVGQELPELGKPIGSVQLVAYAGATWDFYRYHYDVEFAKSQGMPAPITDGQMFGAYLAQLILDWTGPSAFLRKLGMRYKSLVYPGDEVSCWGRVTAVDREAGTVTLELGVRGRDGRDVVAPASALVELRDSP